MTYTHNRKALQLKNREDIMIHVTAAIILREDKVLICQRGAGGSCAYLWEFPGGKVEPGEILEECLVRECKEELDIVINVKEIFAEMTYQYPERRIAFTFFYAEIICGIIKANVHRDVRWVTLKELNEYEFCPADIKIVERLREAILI